jgi:hypothetical protein
MKRSQIIGLVLAITLALSSVGVVWAQDTPPDGGTTDTLPVDGTVIGINTLPDGSMTVDVLLADDTIVTIPVDDSYDHPIVALLAEYFGGAGVEEWSAALVDLTVEIDEFGNTDTVIGVNEVIDPLTGEVTWTLDLAGGGTLSTSDAEQVERILAALAVVNVGLNTTTTGDGGLEPPVPGEEPPAPTYELVTVGGQIQAYHDDGMGFGVLTKLYAMAQESGQPVDTLVTAFKSGMGMGQLFKENGKPSLLGVGHVRKELKDQQDGDAAKVNKGQAKKDAKPEKENKGQAKGKDKNKKKK